jgi:hypothetical protein
LLNQKIWFIAQLSSWRYAERTSALCEARISAAQRAAEQVRVTTR